nr:hypothetical protein [uncultured Roseateles sp.]
MMTVALVCLVLTAFLCVAGVFVQVYHDNILQRAGLSLLMLWTFSQMERIIERGWVWPEALFLYVGLALFGLGTAYKVVKHNRRARRVAR